MEDKDIKELERLARPLIQWMNELPHPHYTILITSNHAELLEGSVSIPVHDYVKD